MNENIERNMGPQPIERIMAEHGLKAHDLVAASTDQITHKMISRACRGRRLTRRVQLKIVKALNNTVNVETEEEAEKVEYSLKDLFNY